MTKFKKVVVLQGYYQCEYDEEHSEEFQDILTENPKDFYTDPITEIEGHKLSGEPISETGKNMLVLRKGQVVSIPVELAKVMVANRQARPHVEVDPDYGFAPVVPEPPLPKEVLTDQGDAEADIEKEVEKTLGHETSKSRKSR